jgi:serine/threonine-protein kinase
MLINEQYLTVKKIGQGGFGVVWKAYDFSLRNFIAIKELLKDCNEPKFIEMFYREALIAKNIIHDNVVRVQHFWQGSNGSYFISMDYVGGNDLEHLMRKCREANKTMPWELIVLICGGVLKALDYANRIAKDAITGKPYGIVYRDISPENIMISYDGGVKLGDFGICKTADDISFNSKRKIITGKFGYMSPEQTRGDADIDHRSDIFSMGVVLYEILLGKKLFTGTPDEVKKQVLDLDFDPTELYSLNVPDELVYIVVKALARDRDNRYEKAIEMFRDLRRLLKGKETEELTVELSSYLNELLAGEIAAENQMLDKVKNLSLPDIKNDASIRKVTCKNFIVGESPAVSFPEQSEVKHLSPADAAPAPAMPATDAATLPASPAAPAPGIKDEALPVRRLTPKPKSPSQANPKPAEAVAPPESPEAGKQVAAVKPPSVPAPASKPVIKPVPVPPPASKPAPVSKPAGKPSEVMVPAGKSPSANIHHVDDKARGEEKGKTVFEEVGDWLANRFKSYKRRVVRLAVALGISAILFMCIDVYMHITSFGKGIYSFMYPPDAVIATVPPGARVSMRSRDGKIIIDNALSDSPIEMRNILPKTYIVKASKEGFRTVERVVRIEDSGKSKAAQRIEIYFDFPVMVDSRPPGAEVYIDGNKYKTAPVKGELTAGEHTIKLTCPGFEELGSLAKENKEGQCNIDFTRSRDSEIFAGVDQQYWTCGLTDTGGEKIFTITGDLFKRFTINSSPKNMLVHVQNESKPRGQTPLAVALKAGEYRIRFMDPDGKYEETTKLVRVDKDAKSEISASLNKWVTLKVGSKGRPGTVLKTVVKVSGNGVNISREISSSRPLRLAIPLGKYRISFESNKEYNSLVLNSVNIAEQATIVGEMEIANAHVRVAVKDDSSGQPIENAYVWLQDRIAGITDKSGVWQGEVKVGEKARFRIVAKGYIEKPLERTFEAGAKDTVMISLTPDKPVVAPETAEEKPEAATVTAPQRRRTAVSEKKPLQRKFDAILTDAGTAGQEKSEMTGDRKVIVCPNCKKEYIVGPKKLRFCTNCGKPFR